MSQARIYFDHNATTPLHRDVLQAMCAVGERCFGNPSSLHGEGRAARQAIEEARQQVAALLGAQPAEIVFTSGGSEGNNLAILGAARAARQRGGPAHVVSSPLEHPSVGAALSVLAAEGFAVTRLPVDDHGRIEPAALQATLARQPAALVSLAFGNHELGNLYPIAELSALAHAAGACFHCDAVQAAGRVPVDVRALGVDLLTLSGHKLAGPKGVGALYCRSLPSEPPLSPLIVGGQQEKGRRAGTENVLGIVGLGRACALAVSDFLPAAARVAALRDRLEAALLAVPGARRHGDPGARVPGTANLAFTGVEGELLFMNLDLAGVAVSTGAACSSGSPEPSPVLRALGLAPADALLAVRFSLGPTNHEAEVDAVIELVVRTVAHIRGLAPPPAHENPPAEPPRRAM